MAFTLPTSTSLGIRVFAAACVGVWAVFGLFVECGYPSSAQGAVCVVIVTCRWSTAVSRNIVKGVHMGCGDWPTDQSVPGVVETYPFGDAPGWYVVLDDDGCDLFP